MRGPKGIGVALAVAVVAYIAWIPAVADDAHPLLAAAAGGVFFVALLLALALGVDSLLRRWRSRS